MQFNNLIGTATTTVPVSTATSVSSDGPPGVSDDGSKKVEYKTVRLRTSDGKTRFKKVMLKNIYLFVFNSLFKNIKVMPLSIPLFMDLLFIIIKNLFLKTIILIYYLYR